MTPDRHTGKSGFAPLMCAGLLSLFTLFGAQSVQAQSAYACRNLETHAGLPAVEGADGTFFAIKPELQSHHGMADDTIAKLGQLNKALSARGTTLVLLPVPTRGQVLLNKLPSMAAHLGFSASASAAVHLDMVKRLRGAGIPVADALIPLRKAALAGGRPYFETDPRLTPQGARILAATVGEILADHPNLTDVTREVYISTEGAETTLPSAMRAQLQSACQSPLPLLKTPTFSTSRQTGSFAATGATFGTTQGSRLVVLGAEVTGTPALNLAGFLSEATGLEALNYGLPKGGAFAAINSYLTSADFQARPPRVLVWEFPVSASMADHGDQPLAELIAAAGGACRSTLATTRSPSGDRLRADLSQVRPDAQLTLSLDTGGAALPFVRFHFTGNDGLVRSRSIYRHPDQILTGQFYMPLSGLNATGLRGVEIEGPGAFGLQARLAACS